MQKGRHVCQQCAAPQPDLGISEPQVERPGVAHLGRVNQPGLESFLRPRRSRLLQLTKLLFYLPTYNTALGSPPPAAGPHLRCR